MGPGIVVEDDSRIEQVIRIHKALQLAHDRHRLGSPLGFEERRHVAAGAVLGLERPAVSHRHHLRQFVEKGVEPIHIALGAEGLVQHEVQVAVLGVAKDDGVVVVVPSAQRLQIPYAVGQDLQREGHVLVDHRGAASPLGAHRGDEPLADRPQRGLSPGISGEDGLGSQRERRQQPATLIRELGTARPRCDSGTPPAAPRPSGPKDLMISGTPGLSSTDRRDARSISSRARPRTP